MPGFNTLPAVGGGGGQANMTFVASIHMNTYTVHGHKVELQDITQCILLIKKTDTHIL